jgi:Ca-activated chloride channel homolog
MVGMTARAMIARASCTRRPEIVNVAADFDIAPFIQTIGRAFNSQNVSVGGDCVQVQVTEGESSAVAAQVDGQASVPGVSGVDAWIPDSSLWVDVARHYALGAEMVQPTGISVARSPLVIVTSQAVAKSTNVFGTPASWSLLLPPNYGGPPAGMGLSVEIPDPSNSAIGLSTLIEVNRALGPTRPGRAGFTKFVFNTQSTADFNSVPALASFVGSTADVKAIAVASEQAVIAYDRAYPGKPLVARYPGSASAELGTPELDYPYVLTTSSPSLQQAAEAFGRYLKSSYAQTLLRYNGFRSANGELDSIPASFGLSSQPLQVATAASPTEAAANLAAWQKLGLGSKDLAIIDVSAAMGAPAGLGTLTLEQELTATAQRGLALFPDSSQMGLWEAPDSLDPAKPYLSLVPLGPLPAALGVITRRAQMQEVDATLRPDNNPLHLNDAILAAYQSMTAAYSANYSNAVLVLTAGVDAKGDMALGSLLAKLKSLYNPSRKVEIVILQFGDQGSSAPLQAIANATGGGFYQITSPSQVAKVFIEAISQRMCDQGCSLP